MKTSKQWWEETKADEAKLNNWLMRQFRGEVTAAHRVRDAFSAFSQEPGVQKLVRIAADEGKHAVWIGQLMDKRGVPIDHDFVRSMIIDGSATKRYWSATDLSMTDYAKTMAVGAHAEKMRLERIQVIADDVDAPADIRKVFQDILVDELVHEQVFRELAGEEAMASTKADHEEGKRLLGLEA